MWKTCNLAEDDDANNDVNSCPGVSLFQQYIQLFCYFLK